MPNSMRSDRARRGGAVLLLSAIFALLGPSGPAMAVDDGTLGIRPASESDFFHLSLAPGSATDATAVVSNHSASPVTLLNYPVDAHTTPQGGFGMSAETDPRTGVGSWITLANGGQITVPAGSELSVPFRLSVPAGTPPGDYVGAVIIQTKPIIGKTSNLKGGTAVRLDVVQRQGVRVYLHVPGTATKRLTAGTLSSTVAGNSATFTLPVRNTGNTILHPTATLRVRGWFGLDRELKFQTPDAVLPGATSSFTAVVTPVPLLTFGTADATVRSEAGTETARAAFTIVPWLPLIAIAGGLGLLCFGIWRTSRWVRKALRALAPRHRGKIRSARLS